MPRWDDDAYELVHPKTKVHSYIQPISVQEKNAVTQALTKITQPFRTKHLQFPCTDTLLHVHDVMTAQDDDSNRATTGSMSTLEDESQETFCEHVKRIVKTAVPAAF